ncbi:Putative membrane protein [Actinoplanes sp. N902-109]|nr:Putative membrane protein [Actinoplanes sp. N902-109]
MAPFAAVLLAMALVGPPTAAQAAIANVSATAQGLRVNVTLAGLPIVNPSTAQSTWQTGQAANNQNVANVNSAGLLSTGAVSASTGPDGEGGKAAARVDGLNLLGAGTLSADTVSTACSMTPASVTGGTNTANLKLLGTTTNPATGLNINLPGILTGKLDAQTATYNSTTGRLSYTVRGLDLKLLGGVAEGPVVVAESTCSGVIKFGEVQTGSKTIVPGTTQTPTVTITNAGEVAAPNTVITIPAPPTGYTLGEVTTTGGGTCSTASTTQIRCTGVTVPGGGSVTVSLPVSLAANAAGAGNWSPGSGSITAVSTPFANVTGTTVSVSGSGRLATVGSPQTTGGSITVTEMSLPAGKTAQTPITVTNAGPSDAQTTVTIPLTGQPDGVSIVSAAVGSNPCTVTPAAITCSGVTVPANDKIEVIVKAAATNTTPPGTTWDLSTIRATLNGYPLTGQGRLLTVSDPDVNLSDGVRITPATAVPGGPAATARITIANRGIVAGTNTTLTIPAPPAGYTVGAVSTTGGGTCTSGASSIYCSGITVPPMGSVTGSVPVTLASNVTANWVTTPSAPVSATSGDSTGRTSGVLITADPRWTFDVTATGPAPRTVRPGQSTTMNVTVTNNGPSDAPASTFAVLAPRSTTFGTLSGTAARDCTATGPTALSCTVTLAADDDVAYVLPLNVSAQADPTTPLDGGCVSFNGDADCDDPGDEPLPGIQLRTPLGSRLTTTPVPVTVTPGLSGTARLRLSSTQDEDGLSVGVPLGALPQGFTVTGASTTAAPGACTVGSGAVTCTGLDLSAGQAREVALTVALAPGVTPPARWTATAMTVSDGDEQVTRDGDLAIAGPPVVDLTATVTGPADNTVLPGATTQLTVVVANAGPSNAQDAPFTVVAPNGTSLGTVTAPASTYCTLASTTRAQCSADIAASAQTPQLVLPLVVSSAADPFTPLGGGCVDLDGTTGCGPDDEPIAPIVLAVPFDRQVTVDTSTATVTPGRQDVATISVTASHGAQNGVSVTVPLAQLPAGLSVASQSSTGGGSCTAGPTQVSCTGLSIPDGQTAVVSLSVAATSGATQGTTWTPTAITVARGSQSVSTRGRLAVVGPPQYTLDATVTPPADPIVPGGTGTLGVVIDNTGPSDATDETISVLAPDGATFGTPGRPTADYCTLVSPTRVSCTFDLPEPATPLRFALPIVVSPGADPGTPLRDGCVDLDNNGVCDTTDEPLPDVVLATPFDRQVDISTTPARVTPGTTGSAQVLLSASPAQTGLTVSIPLDTKPAQMTVGTVTAAPAGSCTVTATAITCTGVNVPAAGAIITVPISVPGDAPANLVWATRAITATNSAGDQATGAGLLVRTGDPQYTLDATITGPPPGTVLPGDTTGMQVTLTNTGASTATDALVTLKAPVGTAFGPLTGAIADSCTAASATRLTCSVTLAVAPASLVWTVPVVVPGNADPDQALTGGCLDLDGDSACGGTGDRPLPDIVLATPLGRIATVSATNTPVVPGQTATTTVTVALSQARDGLRVTIPRDALPTGLTTTGIAVDTGTCTTSAAAYTCGDFSIGAGGSVALRVSLAATPAADPGATWAPAVTVARVGESVSRTVTAATVGAASAPLTVTVVGPAPGTLLPGDTGDLAITVTNPGPSNARNARFTFRAPTGTSFGPLSATVAQFCVRSSATQVDCVLDVAAATDVRFTLQVLVPPTADPDDTVDGGCVDTNRDGVCTSPPDNPIPNIELGAPLTGSTTVATRAGTATPGLSATGYVVVTSQRSANGLTVTVPLNGLPTGFTVTSATGPNGSACQVQPTQVVCTDVTLAAGTNQAVALVVATASNLAAGVTWAASPITLARGTESTQGSGTLITTGQPVPGLRVTVTGPTDPVETGTTTTMTVSITNVGPSDATGQTATVVAPSQSTFGTLSGRAAADCTVVSTTRLSCRYDQAVGADPRVWQIPVVIAADADPEQPASGGCVTTGGTSTCLADIDVNAPFAVYQPLNRTAAITFGPLEVDPGQSGSPTITVSDTSDRDGLSLVVPLDSLPTGFTVSGADAQSADGANASGTCTVQTAQVSCTGMAVNNGDITVTLTVDVAAGTAATAKWTATNVTLTDDDQPTDQLVASGVLVTTGGDADTVTTTFGTPTVNPAAPGQKTVLPITLRNPGPNDATPHVMTLKIPAGLTVGTPLPDDCVWDEGQNVVTCTRDLVVGDEYTYRIPLVVGRTITPPTAITGGCLDAEPANNSCADADDQALPAISVVASRVDLALGVKRKTTTARPGGTVLLKLPYSNNGSQTANGIVFEIDPPTGVNLERAQVLLDASTSALSAAAAAAADSGLTDIDCIPDELGDENAVVCDGPNAAVGAESELWLTVRITAAARKGVHPVRVTISTTSPEGNVVNNTVEALLSIAGAGDSDPGNPGTGGNGNNGGGGGGGTLPKTGQSLVGLVAVSVMLIIGGATARIGARRKPARRG